MLALALAALSAIPLTATAPQLCEGRIRAAVAFTDDSDAGAADAVERALGRACFEVVEVRAGSDDEQLKAAAGVGAPWLIEGKAVLVASIQDRLAGSVLSVDLTAFDTSSGDRRGRAMRTINLEGQPAGATETREGVRVVEDAVHALKNQIAHPAEPAVYTPATRPACAHETAIVLLWNARSDAAGRAAVLRALAARCVVAPDQFDGDRAGATEFARDLKRPLLAVKTAVKRPSGAVVSHVLTVNADVVDAGADSLTIVTHAADTRNALRAADDADAWSKVQQSLVQRVIDDALDHGVLAR